jgi:tellurite methyltransferase
MSIFLTWWVMKSRPMTNYEKLYQRDPKVCGEPFSEFVEFFDRYAGPKLSVLDLGCGQGRDALMVARKGHGVVGVDLSLTGVTQMCEAAGSEGLSVIGEVADLLTYQPARKFDVVILDRTLHMVPKLADRMRVLETAAECLPPEGYLLIADEPSNKPHFDEFFKSHGGTWRFLVSNKNFTFAQRSN